MSWWDDFTGKSAKNALMQSNAQATKHLKQGYGQANSYYNQAAGGYDPYVQSGQRGQTAYENSLGINGQAGSQAAYDAYMGNPAYQAANNYAMGNLERKYNAAGLADSGANRLAMSRAAVEQFGAHQNRLAGLGQQGLQATGAQSGVRQGQGDMAMGYGATRANQATGHGNALAQNSMTGINNLMGVIGTGVKAYGAMYPKGV